MSEIVSQAFAHDIRENLMAVAFTSGYDSPAYYHQVAYYREIASRLNCVSDIERLIAEVSELNTAKADELASRNQWLAG